MAALRQQGEPSGQGPKEREEPGTATHVSQQRRHTSTRL